MVPDAHMHAERISNLTLKDPVMSRVLCWVLHGWPAEIPDSRFRPFISRRHELSAHKNCVLWGSHVVVPSSARREVLAMLHDAHLGIVHMKVVQRCNRLCICNVVDVLYMVSSDSRCVSAVCACSPVELC